MKKMLAFAGRTLKEVVRDPLNMFFGLLFPLILLFLMSAIQANIPVQLFAIERLAPGVAVFGLSFVALFSATLISKDRSTSFLSRLFASPLPAWGYIAGYTLPMLPLGAAQGALTLAVSLLLGLKLGVNLLLCVAALLPTTLLFIAIGLLCGTLLNDKQVGGICGALLTNLSAWLSGIWFDLELVGGAFEKIANALPFVHGVNAARAAVSGDYSAILPNLLWVLGYAVVIFVLAALLFRRKMKNV